MQQLKIPQSPIVTANGSITNEWLVFINELSRLNNRAIDSDTIEKANDAQFNSVGQTSFIGWDMAADSDSSAYITINTQDDEFIEVVPLQQQADENIADNPYALLNAIEQRVHEQEIWGLIV